MTYGGYSDSIVVDQRFVLKVPSNLDLAGTAPLLCAGITTFSPLQADATWARIRKEGNIVASVYDPEVFIRYPNGVACMTHSGNNCAVHVVAFQASGRFILKHMAKDFLTPVTRTTLTADICRKMVSHLIRGDWRSGERIPAERELCQKLNVGRASLREALKALEIMGMIETRLGDGTYVCKRSEFFSRPLLWAIVSSSEAEAHELVEARRLIEVELAGMAAERITPENLKHLGEHLDMMERSKENPLEFAQADINFHIAIGQAAHNSILMNALHLIRNLLQQWISRSLSIEGVSETALEQHKQIFMAIAKKNSIAARAAMQDHLNEMAISLLDAQQKLSSEDSPIK